MLEFIELAKACAPQVHPTTLVAVVRHESGFDPLAINVNGKPGRQIRPKSRNEAIEHVRKLLAQGASFDAGYGQINNANWQHLGITPENVFDPCTNLRAAQAVLVECYQRANRQRDGAAALYAALSCYNTGNFSYGFKNGYVDKVLAGAGKPLNKHKVPALPERLAASQLAPESAGAEATKANKPTKALTRTDAFAQPRPDAFSEHRPDAFRQPLYGPSVGSIIYHQPTLR